MKVKPLKTTNRIIAEGCELVPYSNSLKLTGCEIVNKLMLEHFNDVLKFNEDEILLRQYLNLTFSFIMIFVTIKKIEF